MWRKSFLSAALLVVLLALASAGPSLAQTPVEDSARRVIGLREIALRSDADPREFETYFSDVYARTMAERVPGLQLYLLRGERGDRKDRYLLVWEFDSLAQRNEYFPQPGAPSEKWTQVTQNMPQFALGKYLEPQTEDRYTDYVVLRP